MALAAPLLTLIAIIVLLWVGLALVPPDHSQAPPIVTQQPRNPWKSVAIVLALLLGAVLVAAALVATDVMKLGFSLL